MTGLASTSISVASFTASLIVLYLSSVIIWYMVALMAQILDLGPTLCW